MVRPSDFLVDIQCTPEKRLGLLVIALPLVEFPQTVEVGSYRNIFRAKSLLQDRLRLPEELLGFTVLALFGVDQRQFTEYARYVLIFGGQGLLQDTERLLVRFFCNTIFPYHIVELTNGCQCYSFAERISALAIELKGLLEPVQVALKILVLD